LKIPTPTFAGSAAGPEQFPRDGLPEVAFLGRSNVGKSSLLNVLAGTKGLARVSQYPGRTQLVNFFRVGDEMYLVDLPGYGYAKVPESVRQGWERLVLSYLVARAPLALCVFLVDTRHDSALDERLKAWLEAEGLPYVIAATKADKLGRNDLTRRIREIRAGLGSGARDVVAVSAETKLGIDTLWKTIRTAATERREESHAGH
jgi:GTP-binding protein